LASKGAVTASIRSAPDKLQADREETKAMHALPQSKSGTSSKLVAFAEKKTKFSLFTPFAAHKESQMFFSSLSAEV
jgi:hypothetical protein